MDNELTICLLIRSCSTFSLESTPKVAEKECKLKLIKVYNKTDAKLTRTRNSKHRSFCSATLFGSCLKVWPTYLYHTGVNWAFCTAPIITTRPSSPTFGRTSSTSRLRNWAMPTLRRNWPVWGAR
jgi:hypothetical protein